MRTKLLAFLGFLFIRGLGSTLRVGHVHPGHIEQTPQYILSFWHGHLLMMLHCRFRHPIAVMTSRSKDGEIMARAFDYFGVITSRGSSSRGAQSALRGLIRFAREGKNIVFTPDGPVGPPRIAKDGVIYAAQATGLPILPVAFAAKKKSICDRGIGWSCPSRFRGHSSFTGIRSRYRVTATFRSGAHASSRP